MAKQSISSFSPTDTITFREHVLDRIRYSSTRKLGNSTIESIQLRTFTDLPEFDGMVMEMKADLLAEKLVDKTISKTFKTPATWWQHLKQAYFPAWALKRWPVIETEHKLTANFKQYASYPEANIALPEDKWGPMVVKEMMNVL